MVFKVLSFCESAVGVVLVDYFLISAMQCEQIASGSFVVRNWTGGTFNMQLIVPDAPGLRWSEEASVLWRSVAASSPRQQAIVEAPVHGINHQYAEEEATDRKAVGDPRKLERCMPRPPGGEFDEGTREERAAACNQMWWQGYRSPGCDRRPTMPVWPPGARTFDRRPTRPS